LVITRSIRSSSTQSSTRRHRAHVHQVVDQTVEERHVAADASDGLREVGVVARSDPRIEQLGLERDRRQWVLQVMNDLGELILLREIDKRDLLVLPAAAREPNTPVLTSPLRELLVHGPVPSLIARRASIPRST
jgi:hypothetical protein